MKNTRFVAFLAIVAAPGLAAARDLPGARREGVGVAVVMTVQSAIGTSLSLRLTAQAAKEIAFDVETGWTLKQPQNRRWRSLGPFFAMHMR